MKKRGKQTGTRCAEGNGKGGQVRVTTSTSSSVTCFTAHMGHKQEKHRRHAGGLINDAGCLQHLHYGACKVKQSAGMEPYSRTKAATLAGERVCRTMSRRVEGYFSRPSRWRGSVVTWPPIC